MAEWRQIPLLSRRDIQEAGAALFSRQPLKEHGDSNDVMTSGSTGEPVCVKWNSVAARLHIAFTLRDHLWHRRDFAGTFAVVRRLSDKLLEGLKAGKESHWAPGYPCGPMLFRDVHEAIDDTLDWLAQERPKYLMTYPTFLRALLRRSSETGFRPSFLSEVLTNGEVLPDDLRALCAEVWGARLVDRYSSQETGNIALECPEHDHYLAQAEGSFVEVLDEDGAPCGPGEVGRVVVTPLHNFSMPLIRYEIGDYAEVGEPCSSGRGLPVLNRILDRSRNMLVTPSGDRVWASLTGAGLEQIEPIRQFQLYQDHPDGIDLRLVTTRVLTQAEEAQARQAMAKATGYDFLVNIVYFDEISRSAGGKYEDVLCEIAI